MATAAEVESTCSLLETDVLRHIVALKMLKLYGTASLIMASREGSGWAAMIRMPTTSAPWDRNHYPTAAETAIVCGNQRELALRMLDILPAAVVVVKTAEEPVARELERNEAELKISILSFTSGPDTPPPPDYTPEVKEADDLDEESARLFSQNDYPSDELEEYFRDGARRFSITEKGRLVSGCFAFRNFRNVWEIGGVRTLPEYRGRGLAKKTVAAALRFLNQTSRVPRYQTTDDNGVSLAIARALGLKHFITQTHYLWDRRR